MRFLILVSCLLVMGCAPLHSSTAIDYGAQSLAEAEKEGASKYARYEYFKAQSFLEAAKDKQGYGHYELAGRYAKQAQDLAKEAKKTAVRRRDLELRRVRGKVLENETTRKVLQRIMKAQKDSADKKQAKDGVKTKKDDLSTTPKRRTFKPPSMKPKPSKKSE